MMFEVERKMEKQVSAPVIYETIVKILKGVK